MGSPLKPWERNGALAAAATSSLSAPTPLAAQPVASASPASATSTAAATNAATTSSSAPSIPTRPASFTGQAASMTSPTTAYSSPYNRLGAGYSPYQSSMYGGMGMGMGMGGYGSYGGYGMNGMYPGAYGAGMNGMGMYGQPPLGPGNPSLTQTLESTTQHTFALLQSIVQTFSGLAQMLESTFMATHSSFFALAGVVDQFAQLRNALGGVLGLFGLVRWLKDTLTGRSNLRGEFRDFIAGKPVQGPAPAPAPKASRKPLVIFLLAIFGIPYAMHRLIKILAERQPALPQAQQQLGPLDPTQLTFARARFPFTAGTPTELSLSENEIVAVMGKLDPATGMECDPRLEVETEWWKGRTREGREGWFPRQFVEVLEKRNKVVDQPAPAAPQPEAKKVA